MQTIENRMYVQIRTPHSPLMHPTIRLPEVSSAIVVPQKVRNAGKKVGSLNGLRAYNDHRSSESRDQSLSMSVASFSHKCGLYPYKLKD
uniref:Ovule protein n=1 Tax=Ascaris lumbricoides TaxID=6252 RepID=A0A0M3HEX7_ASCLU